MEILNRSITTAVLMALLHLTTVLPTVAQTTIENLDGWLQESYGLEPGSPPGTSPFWQRNGTTATQLGNTARPTFLHSPSDVFQHRIVVDLWVDDEIDNDWIGFAVGFDQSETRLGTPEYLYFDWKKDVDQTSETSAPAGLALSRVFGFPNVPDFAVHVNTSLSGPANGLEELARAINLGFEGWERHRVYHFEFELRPTSLRVWVDGRLEFDLTGSFEAGRFGCMSNSQSLTTCGNITIEALPDEPALTVADGIPARLGQTVGVPVLFESMGNVLGGVAFTIDYDETCLAFDDTDGDGNGLPDSVHFFTPSSPTSPLYDVVFDPSEINGELSIHILNVTSPILALPDGILATIDLTATCGPISPAIRRDASVRLAGSASYSHVDGRSVPAGAKTDGSVTVLLGDAATGFIPLSDFTVESYPGLSPTLPIVPIWDVTADGNPFSVRQTRNANPGVFFSPFDVLDARISFEVVVDTVVDEDDFGFAVGYLPGDFERASADYVVVQWRQETDPASIVNLFPPSAMYTGGQVGLDASRVVGVPLNIEFIERQSFDDIPYTPNSGLELLAEGATRDASGWENGRVYTLTYEVTANRLLILVDGQIEIDLTGDFVPSSVALFNHSQEGTVYRNLTIEPLD